MEVADLPLCWEWGALAICLFCGLCFFVYGELTAPVSVDTDLERSKSKQQ